jgi:hypothetical protein
LVELLFVVVVLFMLIGLLMVGLRAATNMSRRAVDTQAVNSLGMGVEAFRQEFGFIPPLVRDHNSTGNPADPLRTHPLDPQRRVPVVRSISDQQDLDFLRRNPPPGQPHEDWRYSLYSLPYYLIGALDAEVDGVDGPGFFSPQRDGSFAGGGRRYEPFFDVSSGSQGLRVQDAQAGRIELLDRHGTPFRYYRWEHERELRDLPGDLNVPGIVGDPGQDPQLRNAGYAIVAAGSNRVFGDEDVAVIRGEMGLSPNLTEAVVRQRARADNVLAVGGAR